MHVLADMYAAQPGKTRSQRAIVLFTECLQKRRQVLGPAHVSTLATAHALARTHHATKDYAAAEPLYEECVAGRQAALGNDHPVRSPPAAALLHTHLLALNAPLPLCGVCVCARARRTRWRRWPVWPR